MPTDLNAILAQREELKKRDPEAILLFRVEDEYGDLYRAYKGDAHDIAEYRDGNEAWVGVFRLNRDEFSWVGFPVPYLDAVVARIVAAGKRASVCEPAGADGKPPRGTPVERIAVKGKAESDHSALQREWRRLGAFIYALETFRGRYGREEQRNRWSASIQGGPETPPAELEAVACLMEAAPTLYEACRDVYQMGLTVETKNRLLAALVLAEEGRS